MANYGFIMSRHVNSETTNKYWNECVRCIQKVHQGIPIVIIDDNSNYDFVKADSEYQNIQIVQSEYPGRGELLPYYYFWKNHYWESAVIIHDSVFIQKRIPYRKLKINVLPLWHFGGGAKYDNQFNTLRISNCLKNNNQIQKNLFQNNNDVTSIMKVKKKKTWNGVFGIQSYIKHSFLSILQEKYEIFNMLTCITSRDDRCSLERIMGVLFWLEAPVVRLLPSLFGDITQSPDSFSLSYDAHRNYITENGRAKTPYVKVWSGR